MIQSLVHYLFNERLIHLLPIESSYKTYEDVEQNQFFLSFRSILVSVAVSRDLNIVTEQNLDLIDKILNDETIISDRISDAAIQSILVLIRVLSNSMEYYWPYIDVLCEKNQFDKDYNISSDCSGINTLKKISIRKQAELLSDELAYRVLDICTRIKFNTRSLEILSNICSYSTNNENFVPFENILFKYQNFFKKRKCILNYAKVMDSTIAHIHRFIAASNPNVFFKFIHRKITEPLIDSKIVHDYTNILCNLELLSQIFLVKSILLRYLRLVRLLLKSLTKPVYQNLLLFYGAKCFIFWIMARPKEYIQFFNELHEYNKDMENQAKSYKSINLFIQTFFDEIFNKFNITNLLSTNQNTAFTDSASMFQIGSTSLVNSSNNNSKTRFFESSSIFASSILGKNSVNQSFINDSSTNISLASSNSESSHDMSRSDSGLQSSLPQLEQFVENRNVTSESAMANNDIYSMYLLARKNANKEKHNKNNSKESDPDDETNDALVKLKDLHINIHKKASPQDIAHLDGILALYSHFTDGEPLTYTSPLRFLVILSLFDTDLHKDLNNQNFKDLIDSDLIESEEDYFSKGRKQEIHTKVVSTEKHLGKHKLTDKFKKLSLMPSTRRKGNKFFNLLIKNLNGSISTCETTVLASLRMIIIFFSLTSSVSSIHNSNQSIIFAKRFIPFLGVNLSVGEGWNSSVTVNKALHSYLRSNLWNHNQFGIKYFAAVLQFEPNFFINQLHLNELDLVTGLKKLNLYTESLKIFYRLPLSEDVKRNISKQIVKFLKHLLHSISELLINDYSMYAERLISFEKTILSKTNDGMYNFQEQYRWDVSTPHTPSVCPYQPTYSPVLSKKYSTNDNDYSLVSASTTPISATPMNRTRSGNSYNKYLSDDLHMIAPRPTSSSLNRLSSLTTPERDGSLSSSILRAGSPSAKSSKTDIPMHRNRSDDTSDFKNAPISEENTFLKDIDDRTHAKKIILNIFNIFENDKSFFVYDRPDCSLAWVDEEFQAISKSVFVGLTLPDSYMQRTSQNFINSLISRFEEQKVNHTISMFPGYVLLFTRVICLFSFGIFDLELNCSQKLILLSLIKKYLNMRSHFISIAKGTEEIDKIIAINKAKFPLLVGSVYRCLFMSLSANNAAIHRQIEGIYEELNTVFASYSEYCGDIDPNLLGNEQFQKEIVKHNSILTNNTVLGFQKRIRKVFLKHTRNIDIILIDGMFLLFKKWRLYSTLGRKLLEEERLEARNISGIIASVSGTLYRDYLEQPSEFQIEHKEEIEYLRKECSYFIYKHCQYLNHPNLIIRESSKEILGSELHILCLKVLCEHILDRLRELSALPLEELESGLNFVLLEQIAVVSKSILKREEEEDVIVIFSISLKRIVEYLLVLISKLSQDSTQYYKMVILMSKLFKAIEHSEKSLGIRNHSAIKNIWMKYIIKWFRIAISRDYDLENLLKPHKDVDSAKRDLDLICIDAAVESSRAMAYLTKRLILEIATTASKNELKRTKLVSFGHYFNTLLKGLERTMDNDIYPISIRHKMVLLNEHVISALTNLSKSNIEVSTQFILPMGYSENKNIRTAFLKLFVKILSAMQVEQSKIEDERLEAMDELLLFAIENPEITYVVSDTCTAKDLDAYATVVVNGLNTRNAAHIIVSQLIVDEIRKSTRPMDILRRNSCATRALSLLSKYKGSNYLIRVLRPVLQNFLDNKDTFDVEKVDPDDPEGERQISLFLHYMNEIIDAVCNSVDFFPQEFFYICQSIYKEVKAEFPDYPYRAVGAFVFLRLICPALVNPEAENIVIITTAQSRRPLISLAKAIQNIANGGDNMIKWPSFRSHSESLANCSTKIFNFLKEVCRTDRIPLIPVRKDGVATKFEFSFLHHFMVSKEMEIRERAYNDLHSTENYVFFQKTFLLLDRINGKLGEPELESTSEIPEFILDNSEKYPQLYEFITRQTFRKNSHKLLKTKLIHSKLTDDGIPIISLFIGGDMEEGIDLELVVCKFIKIYARLWSSKHYLVFDCTQFNSSVYDIRKLVTILNNILPDFATKRCIATYLLNVNENFMEQWDSFFEHENVYIQDNVPILFINTSNDGELVRKLHLTGEGLNVLEDMRISLNELRMYEERTKSFVPVSLKIGNKYFQVLKQDLKIKEIKQIKKTVSIGINEVYDNFLISDVSVSNYHCIKGEFTISMLNGENLIFYSMKNLEIVKIFQDIKSKEETEYFDSTIEEDTAEKVTAESVTQSTATIAHLVLVIFVSIFHEDVEIKNIAYNLAAEANITFNFGYGSKVHRVPEVIVPKNLPKVSMKIVERLAKHKPELTLEIWIHFLQGIGKGIVPKHIIPQTIQSLTYFIDNLYEHVYLSDKENGAENISKIFQDLIKLSLRDPEFTNLYLSDIWAHIGADGRLTNFIVSEVISYALERDSEDRSWEDISSIICNSATVELAGDLIKRLFKIIGSFLPSLKLEISTQSWTELKILVSVCHFVFFEKPFLCSKYLPELLYIVSLLMDVGPMDIRISLHELLMNICSSLLAIESLSDENKNQLYEVTDSFCKQKMKFISGFSQHKGKIILALNTSSFASKFAVLEIFVENILILINNVSESESGEWLAKYIKYLANVVFNNSSFLTARATMILGILGKTSASESICKNLLSDTMKIVTLPVLSEENTFQLVSQCFSYSTMVEGLSPRSFLVKQLLWLSFSLLDSFNTAVFEGALILLSKALGRIYMKTLRNKENHVDAVTTLLKSRSFIEDIYEELDKTYDIVWNKENFPHIIISYLIAGYSVPSIRIVVMNCLKTLFINSYMEEVMYDTVTYFRCYVFILFLISSKEEFKDILNEVRFEGEVIALDDNCEIPLVTLDWLSSDIFDAQLSLYQGSILFNNDSLNPSIGMKYILILKYLMLTNPNNVFRIYSNVEPKVKSLLALDNLSEGIPIMFAICNDAVKYEEYDKIDEYLQTAIEEIHSRGLKIVTQLQNAPLFKDGNNLNELRSDMAYERRKIVIRAISRIMFT